MNMNDMPPAPPMDYEPAPMATFNPFAVNDSRGNGTAATVATESREIAEVQGAIILARRFPRDPLLCVDRILRDCTRPTMADAALYAFPKGGQVISGPSIRLAESIARNWGNMSFGVRELAQGDGYSEVEAYAWDMETNTRSSQVFQVSHKMKSGGSIKTLTDPRDIYEHVANQAARRLRARILAVVPGDVVEAAVRQCELTQLQNVGAPENLVASMLEKFADFGVTHDMLAKRLGCAPESATVAQLIPLRRVLQSLKDGVAKPSAFFPDATDVDAGKADLAQALKDRAKAHQEAPAAASAFPKQDSVDGHWTDSNGEVFDADRHQHSSSPWTPRPGLDVPLVDLAGAFLPIDEPPAKPGKGKK